MKFYGFGISNYCNMVKMVLMEKGCEYESIKAYPAGDDLEFLKKSPRGMLPMLETEGGFLTETNLIIEYLEDSQGGVKLLPEDAFEKARVRELSKILEMYIELVARRFYGHLYFGLPAPSEEEKEKAKTDLEKGVAALKNRAKFAPYVAGDSFTMADIFFLYTIDLAADVADKVLGMDLFAEIPGARELFDKLNEMETAKKIAVDREKGWGEFRAHYGM